MKSIYLFLTSLLWIIPTLNAQHVAEAQKPIASYLKDLEELGYCVIPEIFSISETEILYERVWHEFIEKAWPNCKMNVRSNWKESFPMHNKMGIFAGPAGQIQVMWDLRQDPRIVDVFAQIWNTNDLIVSMDGLSLMCPSEIRENDFASWPHVDQALTHQDNPVAFVSESHLKTQPYTIQGQFLFEDSFESDAGFYCIPKSHLRFTEFALQLEEINTLEIAQNDKWTMQNDYLKNFFSYQVDETGNPYNMKQITAARGSLILWDSRTVHWNQSSSKERPCKQNPKVRMVGYLCYVPKSRLTGNSTILRKEAFTNGISTNHNPADPVMKPTQDHIWKEFEKYLEDPSYTQPVIKLTPLGESLLGI